MFKATVFIADIVDIMGNPFSPGVGSDDLYHFFPVNISPQPAAG